MPENTRKFSMHPKLAAFIDLALNTLTLVWFYRLGSWPLFLSWFFLRAILWALFIRLVYYPPELSRWRHFFSLVFFNFGVIVSLLIFVEWSVAKYMLMSIFAVFSAVSFWLLPDGSGKLVFYSKPFRRWLFMMDAFGLAGCWCGIYALMEFQLVRSGFYHLLIFVGSAMSTVLSLWWWRVYGLPYARRFWLSCLVIFILIFELSWTISRWPVGFVISGMSTIWFWYVWWMMLRFNMTPEGINWKKQRFFLLTAVLLFACFMLVANWR